MIEALTLRGFEDGIQAETMIEALTLRGHEDGIRAKIMIEALTLRGLEDGTQQQSSTSIQLKASGFLYSILPRFTCL